MTDQVEFRLVQLGTRPVVRVSALQLTYERRYANWITKLILICSFGMAFLAWPWIRFGRETVTIPRSRVNSVKTKFGPALADLTVVTSSDSVSFRTDLSTPDAARALLID
ncbi:hypothetical protein BHE97_07965 [Aeromicrobium sp. PE09-221]|uniref:hypothetical protein n=1 Tax=Aeromicrobium sp. PE09-221 TaxID=1898043 RepID=UPI000B3E4FB8|nr:hypothetical protein [Aeromicrobium sp. PE09-221]OUZ10278.1 hypothetical protein BHE97_07965 [Aeromicrobium sp. PE09-221]